MTKIRSMRLSDDLWGYVQQEADRQGLTKSDVLRQIIVERKNGELVIEEGLQS